MLMYIPGLLPPPRPAPNTQTSISPADPPQITITARIPTPSAQHAPSRRLWRLHEMMIGAVARM